MKRTYLYNKVAFLMEIIIVKRIIPNHIVPKIVRGIFTIYPDNIGIISLISLKLFETTDKRIPTIKTINCINIANEKKETSCFSIVSLLSLTVCCFKNFNTLLLLAAIMDKLVVLKPANIAITDKTSLFMSIIYFSKLLFDSSKNQK